MAVKYTRFYQGAFVIAGAICLSSLSLAQNSSTIASRSVTDEEILEVRISRTSLPAIRRETPANWVSTRNVLGRIETKLNEWTADGINSVQYYYHMTNVSQTECDLFGITESGARIDSYSLPMERNFCPENASELASLASRTVTAMVADMYEIPRLAFQHLVSSILFSNDEWQVFLTDGYVVQQDDSLWTIAGRATNMPWEWQELITTHENPWHVEDDSVIHPGDRVMLTARLAPSYLAHAHITLPTQISVASTLDNVASDRSDIPSAAVVWALNPMIGSPDQRIESGTNIALPAEVDSWELIDAEGMTPTELSSRLYEKNDYGALISAICPRDFSNGQGSCVLPVFRLGTSPRLQEFAEYLLNQAVSGSPNP